MNGRIDLSQAEAVIDVINAQNEYALKSSMSQLKGSVMKSIRRFMTVLFIILLLLNRLWMIRNISVLMDMGKNWLWR